MEVFTARHPTPDAYFWVTVTLASLALALALPTLIIPRIRSKNMVAIFLTDSHAKTSFWHRNKDAIIIQGIRTAVGFVSGVLLTLLSQPNETVND